eukprot:gene604-1167_t
MTRTPFFGSVDEYVAFIDGDHVIRKVLIANNGIGAVKAIRSIRRWSYETFGNERLIQFVAMATPEDLRANAEYIRLADEVVDVPGGSNNNNYANVNLICELADRLQVDAVMPLWGHASENPNLPNSLLKCHRKVTFIGPPAGPMQALGDKIGSTIIAQSAGVPTIAWNGDGLIVDYKSTGIPQDIYDKANVTTVEDAMECCERIGLPVMIKASEGGGGKGIRKVFKNTTLILLHEDIDNDRLQLLTYSQTKIHNHNHNYKHSQVTKQEDVAALFRQVQGEVPGSPIFVMKLASKCRHLEVQLLADKHGDLSVEGIAVYNVVTRRSSRKVLPSLHRLTSSERWNERLWHWRRRAGTVEYLYVEETQKFAFLELNPRLQVEHPVTESVLGVNLPACQLQVAMGAPLHRIGDIRKLYGRHPRGKDTIDFEYSERQAPIRHCIAVRVTAENPDAGFQPTSGKIQELHFRSSPDVWGYFSVDSSGLVHEFADSQFGHVFAHGPDRESARRAMVVALKELEIRGEIRTTMEYIVNLMQSEDFICNRIDTAWLDGLISTRSELTHGEGRALSAPLVATCGAALQGFQQLQRRGEAFVELLRLGQVPNENALAVDVDLDLIYEGTKFCVRCQQRGAQSLALFCNGSEQSVSIKVLSDGGYLIDVQGKSHIAYSREESDGCIRIILDGQTCMFTPEIDPTRLTSSVAGKITKLLVQDGSHLKKGDPYVEIEVMKMYMSLKAEEDGVVTFQKSEGATLKPGDLIANMALDRPDAVVKAEAFTGTLLTSESCPPQSGPICPHLVVRDAVKVLDTVLEGFASAEGQVMNALKELKEQMINPMLPVLEVEEALSVLRGRLDAKVFTEIQELTSTYAKSSSKTDGPTPTFPAGAVLSAIHQYCQTLPVDRRGAAFALTAQLWTVVEKYLYQSNVRILMILLGCTEKYLTVEQLFDSMSFTDVVSGLRKDHSEDLNMVLELCRSHVNLTAKNSLMLEIIELMKEIHVPVVSQHPKLPPGVPLRSEVSIRALKRRLGDLSRLRQACYSRVSLAASLLLMEQNALAPEQRRIRLHDAIVAALSTGEPVGGPERTQHLMKFAESNVAMNDLILESLVQDRDYQIAALETYVRKVYEKTHQLSNLQTGTYLHSDSGNESYLCPWLKFSFKNRMFTDNTNFGTSQSTKLSDISSPTSSRTGLFTVTDSVEEMKFLFPLMLSFDTSKSSKTTGPPQASSPRKKKINALHIVVMRGPGDAHDAAGFCANMTLFLRSQRDILLHHTVSRVSFFVGNAKWRTAHNFGDIFTFRSSDDFAEDDLFRNIEAPHAFHLDLPRLSNFDIIHGDGQHSLSGNVHLYKAVPKGFPKHPPRYFARLVVFTSDSTPTAAAEAEATIVETLDTMALVVRQGTARTNQIFLNVFAPDTVIQPAFYESALRRICTKYSSKLVRLAVSLVELKLTCKLSVDAPAPTSIRFVVSDPTGYVLQLDQYIEEYSVHLSEASLGDSEHGVERDGVRVFTGIGNGPRGPWEGLSVTTPYSVSERFEKERAEAQLSSDTLYVYDWPILFQRALEMQWEDFLKERDGSGDSRGSSELPCVPPIGIFRCEELVLFETAEDELDAPVRLPPKWTAKTAMNARILPTKREPGQNDCGMVAFEITLRTPEFPDAPGRRIVVICNDITKEAGSFGTREDAMFFKASEYARANGLPRLFLAANSGARIGMAQSLKSMFQVCWTDENDPGKGFKYIYLKKVDYDNLLVLAEGNENSMPVICTPLETNGELRYVITDIIGEEPDLGVENLSGSGLIAGETSKAYDEIFTLTLVVGRTVGIGAYLVRLGQRTIQKIRCSPIILTGYQALNKLMGRDIYSTNDQLGGPSIMFHNGVSHTLADSHLNAVTQALQWLAFIPAYHGASIPIRNIAGVDSVERAVTFVPTKGVNYDPRLLLCGLPSDDNDESNQLGFFDKNSFMETLAGWAKTVVVGRARLGGIPMGVIVTENRTAEATKPADPADVTSREKMVQQAGGVWFPDSAYKTAQALRDFNREEIPCIIFANWRGFSGGQRDMFDEVLKFGSMIVDALVAYKQPLFVYIPPHAELRGGAWVVVDSTINDDVMEFYAAEDSRGGVLEAAGAASIKFREKDVLAAARRLDPALVAIHQRLNDKSGAQISDAERKALLKESSQRESKLMGVYQQLAVHFADLHDTPGRMVRTGVVRKQVDWAESRTFFYWRLRRRLLEFSLARRMNEAEPEHSAMSRKDCIAHMQNWHREGRGTALEWESDKRMVTWYDNHSSIVDENVQEIKKQSLGMRMKGLLEEMVAAASSNGDKEKSMLSIYKNALSTVPAEHRTQLAHVFSRAMEELNLEQN